MAAQDPIDRQVQAALKGACQKGNNKEAATNMNGHGLADKWPALTWHTSTAAPLEPLKAANGESASAKALSIST